MDSLVSLLKKNFFMDFLLYAMVHGSEGRTHTMQFIFERSFLTQPTGSDNLKSTKREKDD